MFKRIRKLFHHTVLRPLPLEFQMEMGERGQHVVKVYKWSGDTREPVKDINALSRYGYREEIETGNTCQVYVLTDEDFQTLQAMQSLNPEIREDGALVFEIIPPILKYLRRKEHVQEGKRAAQLKINEEPLRPTFKVDFDPETGLQVQTGYVIEGWDRMVHADQLQKTADGKYARIGNTFFRLRKRLSKRTQEWLQRQTEHIALDGIPEFFQRDLVLVKKEFNAVLTDLANQIQVINEPLEPLVNVHRDKQGWLDFSVQYKIGALQTSHELLSKRADHQYCQVSPTTWVTTDPSVLHKVQEQIDKLGATPTPDGYRLPAFQFASLEEFIEEIGGRAELSAAYRQFLDQIAGFHADETFQLPDHIEEDLQEQQIQLRPYQRSGVHWLYWLYDNQLHGILADDMGLGKTIQSICVLRMAYERSGNNNHSLIIAPRSVLTHWEREIRRCYPQVQTYRYHGPNRQRSLLQAEQPIVFISTYATIANDIDYLVETPFFYLVLDEGTYIKNPSAKRTQAVKALNAAHRLTLSGTPVENRPAELWSLFDFLMRGHLGRHGTFARLFESPIVAGDHSVSDRLGRRIRPFLLRRKKEDVAKDLPEKIEMNEWCTLTEEQKELYGGLVKAAEDVRAALRRGEHVNYTTNILPIITKLKQICDHPALVTQQKEPIYGRSEKFDRVVEKVEEILGYHEQVVVFSHFLGMLDLLESATQEKRIAYVRIDGSTSNRQSLIDRFNGGEAQVALCSIKAVGYGVNLTAANHVIHADRWWNPAVEDQATDRVHRIGQDRTVYVYRILVEGTLEERIDRLLESKRGMADLIIGAATSDGHAWTREELLELLRPID